LLLLQNGKRSILTCWIQSLLLRSTNVPVLEAHVLFLFCAEWLGFNLVPPASAHRVCQTVHFQSTLRALFSQVVSPLAF
jgi:hypothetical protein